MTRGPISTKDMWIMTDIKYPCRVCCSLACRMGQPTCDRCTKRNEDATARYKEAEARDSQVGGNHYAKHLIQPWDVIEQYGLNYWAGNVLKYVLRYTDKNGVEDLKKARHYLDKLIEYTGDES